MVKVIEMDDGSILVLGRNKYNNLGRYCDMTGRNGFPPTNDRGWEVVDDDGFNLVVARSGFNVDVTLDDITNLY